MAVRELDSHHVCVTHFWSKPLNSQQVSITPFIAHPDPQPMSGGIKFWGFFIIITSSEPQGKRRCWVGGVRQQRVRGNRAMGCRNAWVCSAAGLETQSFPAGATGLCASSASGCVVLTWSSFLFFLHLCFLSLVLHTGAEKFINDTLGSFKYDFLIRLSGKIKVFSPHARYTEYIF